MSLDDRAKRVFQDFEQDVILGGIPGLAMDVEMERRRDAYQMTGHIHEVEVLRADELNGGTLEQSKVLFADVGCVLNRFARNLVDVGLRANNSHCKESEMSAFGLYDLEKRGAP